MNIHTVIVNNQFDRDIIKAQYRKSIFYFLSKPSPASGGFIINTQIRIVYNPFYRAIIMIEYLKTELLFFFQNHRRPAVVFL